MIIYLESCKYSELARMLVDTSQCNVMSPSLRVGGGGPVREKYFSSLTRDKLSIKVLS